MSLTAAELIEVLEDLNPNTEIRLASQPSWPFEYGVHGVVTRDDVEDFTTDEDGDVEDGVAWLVEGPQLRYLPGVVSQAAWR